MSDRVHPFMFFVLKNRQGKARKSIFVKKNKNLAHLLGSIQSIPSGFYPENLCRINRDDSSGNVNIRQCHYQYCYDSTSNVIESHRSLLVWSKKLITILEMFCQF